MSKSSDKNKAISKRSIMDRELVSEDCNNTLDYPESKKPNLLITDDESVGEDHNDGPYGPQYSASKFVKDSKNDSLVKKTNINKDEVAITKMENIIHDTLYSSVSPIGGRHEIYIKRYLDEKNRFPVIVLRRNFLENVKKQFTIYPSEFDKLCEVLQEKMIDPAASFQYIMTLNGSERRKNANCIKIYTVECTNQVNEESQQHAGAGYNMIDIRYWFKKDKDDKEWLPTQAGVRLYISEVRQLVNFRTRTHIRTSEIQKLNMYINTLGCVIIPYFNNYLKENNCELDEKSYKKCSYVLNIKDFIIKMKHDDFGAILCNELDENKTLYKCLNEYQASQFFII